MIIQDDLAVANIVSADSQTFFVTRRNGTSFTFRNPLKNKVEILEERTTKSLKKIEEDISKLLKKNTYSRIAIGTNVTVQSDDQIVIGKYNLPDTKHTYPLIIGNGTSSDRKNILTVNWEGNITQGPIFTQQTKLMTGNSSSRPEIKDYYGSFMKVQTFNHPTGAIWARFWENTKNTNGNGVGIGAGGLTILGSGESVINYYQHLLREYGDADSAVEEREQTYLTSDNNVYIVPYCRNGLDTDTDQHVEYYFNQNCLNMQNKFINNVSYLELSPSSSSSTNGGFIDFRYGQSTNDYTSRIIESEQGGLYFYGAKSVTKDSSSVSTGFRVRANNLNKDTLVMTRTDGGGYYITDVNNHLMGRIYHRHTPASGGYSERQGLMLETTRVISDTNVWNALAISINEEGDQVYSVSNATNFRKALGATGDAGYWTVAQGGTGGTDAATARARLGAQATLTVTSTATVADIITVNSTNALIKGASYVQYGKIAQITITWTNKQAISIPANGNISNLAIGTLVTGKRPKITTMGYSNGDGLGTARYTIATTGVISLTSCEGTGTARTIAAHSSTDDSMFNCATIYILAS